MSAQLTWPATLTVLVLVECARCGSQLEWAARSLADVADLVDHDCPPECDLCGAELTW